MKRGVFATHARDALLVPVDDEVIHALPFAVIERSLEVVCATCHQRYYSIPRGCFDEDGERIDTRRFEIERKNMEHFARLRGVNPDELPVELKAGGP